MSVSAWTENFAFWRRIIKHDLIIPCLILLTNQAHYLLIFAFKLCGEQQTTCQSLHRSIITFCILQCITTTRPSDKSWMRTGTSIAHTCWAWMTSRTHQSSMRFVKQSAKDISKTLSWTWRQESRSKRWSLSPPKCMFVLCWGISNAFFFFFLF